MKKNNLYEFQFLYQTFIDEIEKKEFLKNDIEYSILVEPKHFIREVEELASWGLNRLNSLESIISYINNLFPAINKFVNEPGKPSDIKGLYYTSIKYSQIFEQLLNWMIEVKSTFITEEYSDLKIYLAGMASDLVEELWNFPYHVKSQIEKIKEQQLTGEPIAPLNLNLILDVNKEAQIKFTERIQEMTNTINKQLYP